MAMEGVKSAMSQTMGAQYQSPQSNTTSTTKQDAADVAAMEVQPINRMSSSSKADPYGKDEQNPQEKEPTDATIKQAIKDINRKLDKTVAEFGYHEETHRITIKLKDKETDKVVKEIPADKTLDMLAKMWEMAGILVDEKR